jgi:hypothetical protein
MAVGADGGGFSMPGTLEGTYTITATGTADSGTSPLSKLDPVVGVRGPSLRTAAEHSAEVRAKRNLTRSRLAWLPFLWGRLA